jgi:hypothetical protein
MPTSCRGRRGKIEEAQLAVGPMEHTGLLEVEHCGDHTVGRVEIERVEGALRAGAAGGRVLGERKLEEGVELNALASEAGVVEEQTTRGDVPGAGERGHRRARGPGGGEHAQVAVAQIVSAVRHPQLGRPQPVEYHERVGLGGGFHHAELESVVVAGVHQLEREADRARAGARADVSGHLAQPPEDPLLLVGERIARECRGEVLLERERIAAPGAGERADGVTVFRLVEALVEPGEVELDRRHRDELTRAGQLSRGAGELEVVLERPVPAPALPRHRPAVASRLGAPPLHPHPRLVDRPGAHRPAAAGVLADDGLEHGVGEPRVAVGHELIEVERELARRLAHRMRQAESQVARAQIDPVDRAHVTGEVARQLATETLEVTREPRAHPAPLPRPPPARSETAPGPRGRRKLPSGGRRPPPRPTAFAARNPPSGG